MLLTRRHYITQMMKNDRLKIYSNSKMENAKTKYNELYNVL